MATEQDTGDVRVQNGQDVAKDEQASPQEASTSAPSSSAQGETKERSLLDVVRDAVPEKKEEPAAASPAEGSEEGQKPDEAAPKERDDENYSDVPFNKHPRFRQLLAERNASKADAEQYRQVQRFMRDQGLTAEEAGDLMIVGAMAKRDPVAAWKMAFPWFQNLAKAAGEVLPPELDEMVRTGAMTPEAAFEVSRARAGTQAMQATRTFDEQRRAAEAQETAQADYRNAAVTWEQERRERDPNFEAKVEPILREIAYRRMQGDVPADAAGVRKQLDEVYRAVNASFAPPSVQDNAPSRPRPAMKPVTGGSVAGDTRPKPSSVLEIVQQAQAAG
ncbi:MAG: hypothetical protein WAP03_19310 [Methylorubrum rhodinum]|uniref:hypothetical protein n=1 Tax=Methylorubrum rhodinum TaxID=29428 RepID=UPI003BAFC52B